MPVKPKTNTKGEPELPESAPEEPAPKSASTGEADAKLESAGLKPIFRYGISILILGSAALAAYGLSLLATPTESQPPTALIPKVALESVDAYAGSIDLLVSGTVVPHKEINVAAEVSGRVLKKYPECLAGNFVEEGTPLIQIDPESYELAAETAKAELAQAESRIAEIDQQVVGERRNLELAKRDYGIQKREYERAKNLGAAISTSELDQSRRSVNAALTQLTARTNAIDRLEASKNTLVAAKQLSQQRLKATELDLRRSIIKAPTSGLIVSESVQQDAFVRQGEVVLQFENTEVSEVTCNLTSTDLDWIRKHSKKEGGKTPSIYQLPRTEVEIYDAEEPDVVWKGMLERFSGVGRDPMTKTTPARIIVQQPIVESPRGPRALVRGSYVKCRIEVQTSAGEPSNDLIAFSDRALQPNGDVWFVREKKLNKSKVSIVDRFQWQDQGVARVTIVARVQSGDLKPGDAVVVSPLGEPSVGIEVLVAGEPDHEPEAEAQADPDADETES